MSIASSLRTLTHLALPAALSVCGCSGSGSDEPAATEQAWETIITGDWEMPPGTEGYVCARKTIDQDLYVNAFEAISPPGTHHTLLTMGAPNVPDGITPCTAADNNPLSVFGSGVGTDPLTLPDGIALRIPAGTQLLLNLHLFNTGTDPMTGTSGQRVRTIPEAEVVELAEGLLAGTIRIDLPAGVTKTTTGYCTMSSDTTLIAVAPHMHQLGIHEKVTAMSSAQGDVVINDAPYDFNEQSFHAIEPLPMAQGDRVRVDCTHHNTTTSTVTFGESTLEEMCFAGLYRYPATGNFFICSDDFTLPASP